MNRRTVASDQLKLKRRQEILTAAETVFSATGYAATTMDAVAAEAGLAKGSLYNYFRGKWDLFTQVIDDALAGDEAEIDLIGALEASASQKIDRVLDLWAQRLDYFKTYGALMLEFWAVAARQNRSGELAGVFQNIYSRWRERLGRIVIEGVASGEFSATLDPSISVSLMMGIMDGILVQSIVGVDLTVDARFVETMKRSIRAGLSSPANSSTLSGASDDPKESHEK